MIRTTFIIATLIVILGISGGASMLHEGITTSDSVYSVSDSISCTETTGDTHKVSPFTDSSDNSDASAVCSGCKFACEACGNSVVTARIGETR